ncbi:SWIB complex BAF60b domain-containing protein [Rhodotorula toruloides]|uniref:BY PROTMAP: gi/472584477/gb/EMS22071.1/ SWIB complex BAF60b domain-containing protein [Rhodosporidium toruloides NP11] gi/647395183/emb/CDR36416.1/ RHTO0S02e01838g1_1 [Rhodosporidium toruloides] n=1 Tax=Rhodotorula toruloides TaxID=5286 RepID=A0A0K3CSC1_RHOTO|nr:SWIB complex BAF60b domain-containing protein [Rhodotorula toruloides]PRQ70031.1 hypothetical protein AAT19DRAFT_11684 [Rhodotorula toruloides]
MAMFNVQSLRPDIENILSGADRTSISAKAVRRALQEKYPDLDVKSHKAEIDALTTEVFTGGGEAEEEDEPEPASPAASPKPKLPSFHKIKRSRSPSNSLIEPTSSPAFPLATTTASRPAKIEEDDDEAYARKLQAEYAAMGGGRTTRNGGTTTARRGGKKKSKAQVSDDSGDEDDGGKKKKKRKTSHTGFNKLHVLSDEMAAVCGRPVASRPGVTKYLWRYIKAHELQDPNKKTDILPDETLKKVLPFSRINSFTMAKHIGPHLYPFDPEEHAHLVPPASDDEATSDVSSTAAAAKKTFSPSVGRTSGAKVKSAAEVDSEDDED